MADSPLELYEKAYKLHYVDNSPSDARRVYQAIVNEFPESNEAGYAVIQLQKITAAGISFEQPTAASREPRPLLIFSAILNFLTLAMIVLAFIAYTRTRQAGSSSAAAAIFAPSQPAPDIAEAQPEKGDNETSPAEEAQTQVKPEPKPKKKPKVSAPRRKRPSRSTSSQPKKSGESPLLVPEDSISFF